MKSILFVLTTCFVSLSFAQLSTTSWSAEYTKSKSFIENKGQFDEFSNTKTGAIEYAVDFGATRIFFGKNGISYSFLEATKIPKEVREELRKKMDAYPAERRKYEKLIGKFLFKSDVVNMTWANASNEVEISGKLETSDYHNYSYKKAGTTNSVFGARGFKKLVYRNIYPKIDIEYIVHPEIGIKYSFIVHPGGDPAQIKMTYDRSVALLNGKLKIPTQFGDITDHEPYTFYQDDQNFIIGSSFTQSGSQIGLSVNTYDKSKTIVIDPWTQTPAFNTNWDVVWECERDGSGNVYILGGISPMQILKYNPTGTLQWTYSTPYDTANVWLGTFAVDNVGNSYVTAGSEAQIQKVSSAGALVWDNPSPGGIFTLTEFWNIAFNCDQTRLIIGGTGGNIFSGLTPVPVPYVYDVNMSNGNVISSQAVTGAGTLGFPPNTPEVRAIIATTNNKYYYLTHDSIGYINDDLSLCPGATGPFRTNNSYAMSYKCEDFRYDNSGIEAIGYYGGFVFVNRGNRLDKRDFNTGAILQSVTIPGGGWTTTLGQNATQNSGISIDDCGNIFVGSKTGVYKFDQSLTQLAFYPTSFFVYDVEVNTNGEVIACGGTGNSNSTTRSGGVQTFAASACAPQAFTCCDASVCPPDALCTSDAPITLTPATSGGTWSGPGVNASGVFNPATAGSGTHTITYTLPCGSESFTITVNTCATLNVCEETNGTLTVSNGTGPYTWENWVPASSSPITNQTQCESCGYTWFFGTCIDGAFPVTTCNTPAGWATIGTGTNITPPGGWTQIQVTDSQGNTIVVDPSTLIQCGADPCAGVTISVNIVPTNVSCFGGANGSATASASGATGNFTYSWSPSGAGASITNLSASTYTVTATSQNGCTGTASVIITEPSSGISVTTSSTPTNCGQSTGTATANASGGSGALNYSWSPTGGSASTATNLSVGTYTVTVTDANSCSASATVTVSALGGPTLSLTSTQDVTCNAGTDGAATVSGSGGSGMLTYTWTPGGLNGATQNSLSSGTYTVSVSDQNNCSNSIQVTINEPPAIQVTAGTITPANCGVSDGAASVTALGGTGALNYSWSPTGGNSSSATNIPGGSYIVTVTDQSLCTSTLSVVVNTIGGPTVTLNNQTNVSCFGGSDGSASVTASGGTAPYQYTWSPSGGSAASASGLTAGTYSVAVTDDAGCIGSASVTITSPTALTVSANTTAADCGNSNGSIILNTSGGTAPYSYSWSPSGGSASTASGLAPGTYTATITDALGCQTTTSSNIVTIGDLDITATPDLSVIDQGDTVVLTVSGATSYSWSPSSGLSCTNCSSPTASPALTTTYLVTGSDGSGCTGTATVTIVVNEICGDLYVPTVFAPNSSSGNPENEKLCVYGNCISSLSYSVYDRWGNKVFETTDTALCWDGTFKGKDLNAGAFAYKLIVTLNNGDYIEQSGNVTLIR